MRLALLLAELPHDELERLALEHLGDDQNVTRAALCTTLESVLRSYSFVRRFVADRLPPTFAILEMLLDATDHSVPLASFRDGVMERTRNISQRIADGDLLARSDSLRVYRKVLVEARRGDVQLDASETALLGVLRKELEIRSVEHFLIEHHDDFREFWDKEHGFLTEMHALRSYGLLFAHHGAMVLAEEVVPLVRQSLGLEMPAVSRRRLYEKLTGAELADALAAFELKTSGARDEKLERLLAGYVQPSEVLRILQLQTLRELCRDAELAVSGSKEDLVERLAECFLYQLDQQREAPAPVTEPEPEPRSLGPSNFCRLFASLKGDELTDILAGIDSSRVTGAKETKVGLLVGTPFAEKTLLQHLTNRSLEDVLARHRLRSSGSKSERIARLIEHFRTSGAAPLGGEGDSGSPLSGEEPASRSSQSQ
jgi:hypothetical protein